MTEASTTTKTAAVAPVARAATAVKTHKAASVAPHSAPKATRAASTSDRVSLGERPFDANAQQSKDLATFARSRKATNGAAEVAMTLLMTASVAAPKAAESLVNSSETQGKLVLKESGEKKPVADNHANLDAETTDSSSTKKGAAQADAPSAKPNGWDHADNGGKIGGGALNICGAVDLFNNGEYGRAALQGITGATDVVVGAGKTVAREFANSMAADLFGKALSGAGVALSAYDTVEAVRAGNEVAAVEKGLDTVAGTTTLVTSLGAPAKAIGLAKGLAVGQVSAGVVTLACASAAATGYGVGRAIGSNTCLDAKFTNAWEKHYYYEGLQQLDNADNTGTARAVRGYDDQTLQAVASGHTSQVARAITGNLTAVENANRDGQPMALRTALMELKRLRAAQRGELYPGA